MEQTALEDWSDAVTAHLEQMWGRKDVLLLTGW